VTEVAYLRKEKETFEIDYPLAEVWAAIPDVLNSLQWTIEEKDDTTHRAKIKTKPGFMSYRSKLTIEGLVVDEKKCRITMKGETPVTTITALTDFGRTSDRIQLFFEFLAKRMNLPEKS
jgi:carbon monoxide dehydrogenase subunit G